ncbi:MAG: hypothetical protein ACFE95_01480 [Candidatus Hodarchaeota archaeon]
MRRTELMLRLLGPEDEKETENEDWEDPNWEDDDDDWDDDDNEYVDYYDEEDA